MRSHYMTKEGVSATCRNCLYYRNFPNGVMGVCGNANHPHYLRGNKSSAITNFNHSCEHFCPKHEYRL